MLIINIIFNKTTFHVDPYLNDNYYDAGVHIQAITFADSMGKQKN